MKILAFMMDNASNNDTLIDGIEKRCRKNGIFFNGLWSRLRCMPHTVHLAAIQVNILNHLDFMLKFLLASGGDRRNFKI